jgi:four helix bundle protein
MINMNKIKKFTDLRVWIKAHKLALSIYKTTKKFPKEEIFGLISQMRRCSISITSNIAEGFSRQSYKEKTYFYSISLGSVTELQSQLIISRDVDYLNKEKFNELFEDSINTHKMLNGLIKNSKKYYS